VLYVPMAVNPSAQMTVIARGRGDMGAPRRGRPPGCLASRPPRRAGGSHDRPQSGVMMMSTLLHDIRFALRQLRRSPGFTTAAVLTLAVGIGVTASLFSVLNGVLLRPLPFDQPDRLVQLYSAYPDDETRYPLSAPDFMSVREEAESFTGVAAYNQGRLTLTGMGDPTEVDVGWVSADYFPLLGAAPAAGRLFRAEENQPGRTNVAVLSHGGWQRRFGGDPGVLGRTLELNGVSYEVVGVLQPGMDHPADREIYLPLTFGETFDATTAAGRRSEWLGVIGRLGDGATHDRAATELATLTARLREAFPETNVNISLQAVPLRDHLLGNVRTPLMILMGAVALVLLIACGNVANLLLARGAARRGELAVRAAMGAGRRRLVGQMLTESVVLWIVGGIVALGFAFLVTRGILFLAPEGIPRLDEVGLDWTTLGFTVAAVLATGVLFGLVPALQATRGDVAGTIREGGRSGSADRSGGRLRSGLVVAEVALAVFLVIGAGLLLRSFAELTTVDPGFQPERIVSVRLSPPVARYENAEALLAFYGEVIPRLEAIPGVTGAAGASMLPLTGAGTIWGFGVVGRETPEGQVQDAYVRIVTPDYLRVMGIPLRSGRAFSTADRGEAPPVVLVNEAMARRHFAGQDPLGQRITLGGEEEWEVVGVVGEVRQDGLAQAAAPEMYFPHAQFTSRGLNVVLRTDRVPSEIFARVRAEIHAMDPALPVEEFRTGEQLVASSLSEPRFYSSLIGLFAATALLLAAVGIFGVIAFTVARRTREIGIRMALGADAPRVVRSVVGGALMLAAIGVAAGLALAFVGSRLLEGSSTAWVHWTR
jgi:putative ABC transport system permease protein